MKEGSWEECKDNDLTRIINPDIHRSESLLETAKERINLINEINKKNCNFIFEDFYTSLLEILHAISFKKGFNILNHICIGYFLRDFLKKENLYRLFEDVRYKRNSLTYYGIRMEFEVAKQAINICKKIIDELIKFD